MEHPVQRYEVPASIDEATAILADGNATVLAGGTDLMPQSQAGRVTFGHTLVNITRIDELKGISKAGETIRLGALTTVTDFMNDEVVQRHLPALVECGDHFASSQIRNAATIGGNIMNASPAGDTLIPFLIYDAEVELASRPNGTLTTRRVPIREFFAGPGQTHAKPGELLVAVHVPVPPAPHFARFYKFGTRPALDISAISIGVAGVPEAGALTDVRVAFGAVAPTPIRAAGTERAIEGRTLDEAAIEEIATLARDEISPIDDVRATAWYRRELIHNVMKRILSDVS